jgi:hypothetical protein
VQVMKLLIVQFFPSPVSFLLCPNILPVLKQCEKSKPHEEVTILIAGYFTWDSLLTFERLWVSRDNHDSSISTDSFIAASRDTKYPLTDRILSHSPVLKCGASTMTRHFAIFRIKKWIRIPNRDLIF